MNILGNKIGFFIDGSGILAESISLSQSNSLANNRFIGTNSTNYFAPQGPQKIDVSINYLLNLATDPVFKTLSAYKTNFNNVPSSLNIGGITGLFYLNNYSFRIEPNSPVFISSSYTNYNNITGYLTGIQYDLVGDINDRIATSCSTFFSGSAGRLDDIFSVSYNVQLNWKPQYKIGSKIPYGMNLLSVDETMEIETNIFNDIDFYGNTVNEILSGYNNLVLSSPISNPLAAYQIFDLSQSVVQSISTPIANSSFIRNKYSFTKSY